jgi:anhydro-N-acetylmuramic acid kinase
MDSANIYLGLMSGTSIDSIDVAAVEFTQNNGTPVLLGSHSHPIPETLKQQILTLCLPGSDSVQLLCETDNLLGELFAEAALTLISSLNIRVMDRQCVIRRQVQIGLPTASRLLTQLLLLREPAVL